MKKISWYSLFFLLFGCLGYFREFFFVQMNNIMYQKYYNHSTDLEVAGVMTVFLKYDYTTLYYSKYVYTLLSVAIFFLANYLALKKLTKQPFLIKTLFYAYIIMLLLSIISMAYGYFIKGRLQDDEYTISRWLMGIAQSPLICLILLASEKLYKKSFQS